MNYMKKKLLIGLLLSVLLIAAVFITAVFAKTDIGGAIMAILLVVGVILLITTVKSLARFPLAHLSIQLFLWLLIAKKQVIECEKRKTYFYNFYRVFPSHFRIGSAEHI